MSRAERERVAVSLLSAPAASSWGFAALPITYGVPLQSDAGTVTIGHVFRGATADGSLWSHKGPLMSDEALSVHVK